jgi:hypothetical protein
MLADVHASLAYYYDHREEILEEIRAAREQGGECRSGTPSALEAKLHRHPLEEAS